MGRGWRGTEWGNTMTTTPGTPAGRSVTTCMSSPVIEVRAEATLTAALELLYAAGVRHLVVVDSTGRCQGMLADRAIAAEWARDPANFATRRTGEILTPCVPTVPISASVADAARRMRLFPTGAVLVVAADGRPAGIVTATDLVAVLAGRDGQPGGMPSPSEDPEFARPAARPVGTAPLAHRGAPGVPSAALEEVTP